MKKRLIFIAALHCTLLAGAQAYKDSVRAQFLRYTDLLIQKKTAQSMNYMNPAFFSIVPKEQLIKLMDQVYNTPGMTFTIGNPSILAIEDSKLIGGMNYVKLSYSSTFTIQLEQTNGKPQDTTGLKTAFGRKFGPENVRYDAATDTYNILTLKQVIANSTDKKKWTFVVVEEQQKPILERFIPKSLL